MDNKKEISFMTPAALWVLFLLYTAMVKVLDVKALGPNGSEIGFASVNVLVFNLLGTNKFFYVLTQLIGFLAIGVCAAFGFVGLCQLIKRRKLLEVDHKILLLGVFYIIVMAIYFFFTKVAINCRPILVDGELSASYPSSHTMLAITVFASAAYMAQYFQGRLKPYKKQIINACYIIIAVTIIGRLLSGYHWLTDIIGSIMISMALVNTFVTAVKKWGQ